MELKQIKDTERIIFLKEFTQELIISFAREEQIKSRIEIEKLKRKFVEPVLTPEEAFKKIIRVPAISSEEFKPSISGEAGISAQKIKPKFRLPPRERKSEEKNTLIYPKEPAPLQNFKLEVQKPIQEFNLGKIGILFKDPMVRMIECHGSEKELLVKKNNKIFKTKIILNQKEIAEVLDSFSRQAKIPIIGGVFKAVAGDLIISALISEFVDSKFIITRISPYSFIPNK
jgi:hypothetical protein